MSKYLTRLVSLILSFSLILEQSLFAQAIDFSHYFANSAKPVLQSDKFRPLHLRSLGYDNLSNDFKILLDKGDTKKEDLENKTYVEENTQTLLKYFFIGLALPNEKFWVNLRPDSPDNILDPELEKTDIGRIFLEADVQLKKDTAGMTSPQTPEGKAYWDKLYKKSGELFGSENITIPTITRPWIVPNEIIIREAPDNAYIYKATLKVMLEEDYLTSRGGSRSAPTTYQQYAFSDPRLKELNEYSTQLIRELIIPKLTYQVNTSKRYAPLRQVYYSLILAQWFKQKYSKVTGSQSHQSAEENPYVKLIDSGKLIWDSTDNNSSLITHNFSLLAQQPYDKQAYFKQYQQSFKDGEYNLQEPIHTPMGQSIRMYMSGGIVVNPNAESVGGGNVGYNPEKSYLIKKEINFSGSPMISDAQKIDINDKRKNAPANEDAYLIYHATVPENLDSIAQHGLMPFEENMSFPYDPQTKVKLKHIYGVIDPEKAVEHIKNNGVHDSDPALNAKFSKIPVLLELRLPKGWVRNRQEAREKQGNKMRWEIFENDLRGSLAKSRAGIVIPLNNVPPEFIFVQSEKGILPIKEYMKLMTTQDSSLKNAAISRAQEIEIKEMLDKYGIDPDLIKWSSDDWTPDLVYGKAFFTKWGEDLIKKNEDHEKLFDFFWFRNKLPEKLKAGLPGGLKEMIIKNREKLNSVMGSIVEGNIKGDVLRLLNIVLRDELSKDAAARDYLGSIEAFHNNKKGGIDFTSPSIMTQPINSLQSLVPGPIPIGSDFDFDKEWVLIQQIFSADIHLSVQRLVEFSVAVSGIPAEAQRKKDVIGLVIDLLRGEEEDDDIAPTDPALKVLLSALEA